MKCATVRDDGLLQLALLLQRDAEVVVRIGVRRIEGEGLPVGLFCFRSRALFFQRVTEIDEVFEVSGVQRNRLSIGTNRFFSASGLVGDDAKVEPIEWSRRLLFDGGCDEADGLVELTASVRQESQKMVGFGMLGRQFEREAIGPFRFRQAAGLMMGPALIEQRANG